LFKAKGTCGEGIVFTGKKTSPAVLKSFAFGFERIPFGPMPFEQPLRFLPFYLPFAVYRRGANPVPVDKVFGIDWRSRRGWI